MATQRFDLVVIGTGTAASAVATHCRTEGWTVAVIDSRPFGGTCALRGCDPKKVLVAVAEAIEWSKRMADRGFLAENPRIDWPGLARTKRTFTDPVPRRREEAFREKGIAAYHGRARFVARNAIRVGEDVLEGRHVVIASGARPTTLGFRGEEHLTTSDRFLDLEAIPRRVVFVGGGYVSMEFAHVAARAGSQVTVLHRGPRLLGNFDPDLVGQLTARSRELGIAIEVDTTVEGIERRDNGFEVHATSPAVGATGAAAPGEAAPRRRKFEGDMVVHGAGRVPEIDDLDLATAGIEHTPRGIKVNDYLQSVSNPVVYAAGDAADNGGLPLLPVAGYQGRAVAANLLQGNKITLDYTGIPSVVFTVPPLASAGMSEDEAKKQGLGAQVKREDTSSWFSSRRIGESCSGFKTLVEEKSGRILGAHLLGPGAEEVINLFAFAIRQRLPASALKEMLWAYPTHGSDLANML